MPKQLKTINLEQSIYYDGAGDLKLGLNIFFLRELYIKGFTKNHAISVKNKNEWWTEFDDPNMQNLKFCYKNIVEIYCNIFIGKIWGIKFKKGYKGKLWDSIEIGDKVEKLFKYNDINDAEFIELCDGNLFLKYNNSNFNISVKIGDTDLDYVETDEELINYEIQEFFIINDDLVVPFALLEFPEKWKNSSSYKIGL